MLVWLILLLVFVVCTSASDCLEDSLQNDQRNVKLCSLTHLPSLCQTRLWLFCHFAGSAPGWFAPGLFAHIGWFAIRGNMRLLWPFRITVQIIIIDLIHLKSTQGLHLRLSLVDALMSERLKKVHRNAWSSVIVWLTSSWLNATNTHHITHGLTAWFVSRTLQTAVWSLNAVVF